MFDEVFIMATVKSSKHTITKEEIKSLKNLVKEAKHSCTPRNKMPNYIIAQICEKHVGEHYTPIELSRISGLSISTIHKYLYKYYGDAIHPAIITKQSKLNEENE